MSNTRKTYEINGNIYYLSAETVKRLKSRFDVIERGTILIPTVKTEEGFNLELQAIDDAAIEFIHKTFPGFNAERTQSGIKVRGNLPISQAQRKAITIGTEQFGIMFY